MKLITSTNTFSNFTIAIVLVLISGTSSLTFKLFKKLFYQNLTAAQISPLASVHYRRQLAPFLQRYTTIIFNVESRSFRTMIPPDIGIENIPKLKIIPINQIFHFLAENEGTLIPGIDPLVAEFVVNRFRSFGVYRKTLNDAALKMASFLVLPHQMSILKPLTHFNEGMLESGIYNHIIARASVSAEKKKQSKRDPPKVSGDGFALLAAELAALYATALAIFCWEFIHKYKANV